MTKAELIDSMASKTGLSKTAAEKALGAFIGAVEGALKGGDKVALPGFGTFTVSERAARTGKNPQTGEPIQIAASKAPKFKPGKTLKEAVQ